MNLLKDCNVNCNLVLTEMSNLLVELFKSTVFVGWSTSISPNLLQSLQNLWDRYNGTLDSLLQPVYNYRNKVSSNIIIIIIHSILALSDNLFFSFSCTTAFGSKLQVKSTRKRDESARLS